MASYQLLFYILLMQDLRREVTLSVLISLSQEDKEGHTSKSKKSPAQKIISRQLGSKGQEGQKVVRKSQLQEDHTSRKVTSKGRWHCMAFPKLARK